MGAKTEFLVGTDTDGVSMAKGKKKVEGSHGSATAVQPKPVNCPERRLGIWLAAGFIITIGIITYSNSFDGVFVCDDFGTIKNNLHIRKLWPLSEAMSLPLWKQYLSVTVFGRPILSLSFAINYALTGPEPWGYHLGNLIIHIGAALLLFGVIRRTLCYKEFQRYDRARALWAGLVVALIWMVHPIHTESVTFIAQRAESLMGMFFLLTLYCAIRGFQSNRRLLWYSASVLVCSLGMGTKEVMAAAPVLILLYDYAFVSKSFTSALRQRRLFYLSLAGTWVIVFALVIISHTTPTEYKTPNESMEFIKGCDVLGYVLSQPAVILEYSRFSIWPRPLGFQGQVSRLFPDVIFGIRLAAIIVIVLLALSFWGFLRRRWFGFLGVWFFIILAPSSSLVPTMDIFSIHRMYLSLASVVTVIVFGGDYVLRKLLTGRHCERYFKILSAILVAGIVTTYSLMTYERNKDYQNAAVLLGDESTFTHYNLAMAYIEQGDLEQAVSHYKKVLQIDPNYAAANHSLGLIFMEQGKHDQAAEHFKKEIHIKPNYPHIHISTHYNLGMILMQQRDLDAAKVHYKKILRINPNYADAYYHLGNILAQQGNMAQAKLYYEQTLRIEPDYAGAYYYLGNILMEQGNMTQAKLYYEQALRIEPDYAGAYYHLGNILMEQRNMTQAKLYYEQALRIEPNCVDAHNSLGIIFANQGNIERAKAEFEHEIRINPNHIEARYNLGNIFLAQGDLTQAAAEYVRTIGIEPGRTKSNLEAYINSHINLGVILTQQDRLDKAIAYYEKVLVVDPNNTIAMNNLAWLLATYPDDNFRNGKRAVELAERSCNITDYKIPELLDTLAAAYSEEKRFTEAIETATKALDLAELQKNPTAQIQQIQMRLEQYKIGKPYHRKP